VSGSAGRTRITAKDLASSAGATLSEGPSREQACALIQPARRAALTRWSGFGRHGAILGAASSRYSDEGWKFGESESLTGRRWRRKPVRARLANRLDSIRVASGGKGRKPP
jgi:hypothetical protein